MAPSASSGNKSHGNEGVDFEGLQPLLRRGLSCSDLEVLDCTVRKLLPLGENYCSVLLKIEATVRRSKNSPQEKLSVVAKTHAPSEKPVVDWLQLLPKEVFMYTELLPAYRSIEREAGVEEGELCDILPRYMGHRFSMRDDDDDDEKVDETSLLLMENLVTRGYYLCDRFKGLDFEHASKSLTALAKYHALGIALKRRRPEFFEKVIAQAQVVGFDLEQMSGTYGLLKQSLSEAQSFSKHMPIIGPSFDKMVDWSGEIQVGEPWASITHGDFWCNNMLFRSTDGEVDDVKFVDFQNYHYSSPLRDLAYFFCASLDDATQKHHFDDLLDLYYETFIGTLKRMGCDATPFTRQSFDEELKERAIEAFPMLVMVYRFIKYKIQSDDKDIGELTQNLMNDGSISDKFRDILLRLVQLFEDKKWF